MYAFQRQQIRRLFREYHAAHTIQKNTLRYIYRDFVFVELPRVRAV